MLVELEPRVCWECQSGFCDYCTSSSLTREQRRAWKATVTLIAAFGAPYHHRLVQRCECDLACHPARDHEFYAELAVRSQYHRLISTRGLTDVRSDLLC